MALAPAAFNRSVEDAIAAGPLGALPALAVQRLRVGAIRTELPASTIVHRACDEPQLGLVVDGVIRFFLDGPDGRRTTSRYARVGQLVGAPSLIGVPRQLPIALQAVTDTSLLVLDPAQALALMEEEPRFAIAIASDLTRGLWDTLDELGRTAFGSVRDRVAHHLLDLAAQYRPGGPLVVRLSQQEIADAVGSVREVVARVLRQLREEGLVTTGPSGIVILDVEGLVAQTWTGEPPVLRLIHSVSA